MQRTKSLNSSGFKLGGLQASILVVLRMLIGWHFLYEGLVKLTNPEWTSVAFLAESKWLLSDFFHWIVANPAILDIVDAMNTWGLILIGLGLFLGALTRVSAIAGILLLALYYVANPPLIGLSTGMPTEGNYLFVDKNLIEMMALLIIALLPTGRIFGLDGLFASLIRKENKKARQEAAKKEQPQTAASASRRAALKHLATVPLLGAFVYAYIRKLGYESYEEKHLMDASDQRIDSQTGATVKTFQFSTLKDLKGTLPKGKIKDLEVSRLFLGGNLIGGWAHARDLIYVSKLVKSYHTDRKVFDTLKMAEHCGITTLLTNPQLSRVINEYWRKEKGTIQFFSDCGYKGDAIEGAKISIDSGAHACYVQGEIGDRWAAEGRFYDIARTLDITRNAGLPAGIGAHKIETIKACVEQGLKPDFWVKTLHHTNYWSAIPKEKNDNIWCEKPQETIQFMENLQEPWIAFKVLAAGAIHPNEAFPYALKNGVDFLCVGMYDFQIVEDVNIALNALNSDLSERSRPWRA